MSRLTGEVQRLARALLERIVSGVYPAGLRLPSESDLATEFACGRSTVREALRHLADMGVVRSRRGSGALVLDFRRDGTPALLPVFLQVGQFEVDPAVLGKELLRLRSLMACEAVRLAACYGTADGLREARALLAEAPALSADPAAHAANEVELYRALVASSGIWPSAWLVNSFWAPFLEVHRLVAPVMGPVPPRFQRTMEQLLDLIEERDEAAAVELVQSWFSQIDRQLSQVLEHAVEHVRAPSTPANRASATAGRRRRTRRRPEPDPDQTPS